MVKLSGKPLERARYFLGIAEVVATNSDYPRRARTGAIIVADGVIGSGYNMPISQDACRYSPVYLDCVHSSTSLAEAVDAEHRAILDLVRKGGDPRGATMYFVTNGYRTLCPRCFGLMKSKKIKLVMQTVHGIELLTPKEYVALPNKEYAAMAKKI